MISFSIICFAEKATCASIVNLDQCPKYLSVRNTSSVYKSRRVVCRYHLVLNPVHYSVRRRRDTESKLWVE